MTGRGIGGPAHARISAAVGGVAWAGALLAFRPQVVDAVVLLATFVLLPAAVAQLESPARDGSLPDSYRAVVVVQPLGALGSLVAVVGSGTLAALATVPWIATMGLLAGYGLVRFRERGPTPVGETLIDAGTVYSTVGPGSYLLYVLGIDLGFPPTIVHLTAAHFHYAGLLLPVVGGLAGRVVAGGRPWTAYRVGAWVVVAGMPVVAAGITLSHLAGIRVAELFGAGAFAAGAGLLAATLVGMGVAPGRFANRPLPGAARAALAVAGASLLATMAMAAGYGYARAVDPGLITVGTMVRYHGLTNAFGFATFGLLAWEL